MAFLTGIEIRKLINEGRILIRSLDEKYPFSIDGQVTEDSLDLRLAPVGLKLKSSVKKIDYVKDDLPSLFETVEISPKGYSIKPNEVLFTQTLEAVTFPAELVGLVVTRSTFSRLGLMINCSAPKFAAGISWAFPLQLVNCNNVPIIIYPYSVIAQLMVSSMLGTAIGYEGRYQNSYSPTPPVVNEREKKFLLEISPDVARRTHHILIKELEAEKNKIKQEIEVAKSTWKETKIRTQVTKRQSGTRVKIYKLILGILSALGFGIAGNLLSSDDFSYWKTVSLILLFVIGIILALISIYLPSDGKTDSDESGVA